ncbi:hypothetical protein J6590_056328 [Homalodisca vitripennis]|nr:hypothetical protein J6590_056328 [Homalodisca vitripennis]
MSSQKLTPALVSRYQREGKSGSGRGARERLCLQIVGLKWSCSRGKIVKWDSLCDE